MQQVTDQVRGAAPDAAVPGETGQEVYTFPLSFAQEGLWLLSQIQQENPAYHIPKGFFFNGPLRADVLERSLDAVVARHEVLRTTFAVLEGEAVQVVSPHRPRALPRVDLTGLAPARRDAEAGRLALEEARRPFDLVRGPLLRARLLRLAPERHLLLCTAHHLVFDGWSEGVFLRELTTLYRAFAAGEDSPLPEPGIQYGDYAHWERESLQGEALDSLVDYWRTQLAGAPDAIRLPNDHPYPAEPTHRGGYRSLSLPPEAARALAEVGRGEGATSFAPLLAVFGIVLHRLSGEEDVLVGSTSARRDQVELERMIGFFVTPLVLRLDLSGDPSFRELVRRVSEVTYAAQEHQALPFGKLVSELRPRRDPSRNPFFQVLFNYDSASSREHREVSELAIQPLETGTRAAQFELTLSVFENASGMRATLTYSADLFEEETAAEMLRHLDRVLREAAAAPERRLSEMLLTEQERRQVLVEWNRTARPYPAGACLHEWVAAQAARTPDAPAVVFEEAVLPYAELDRRSARLANHLRALGVGPETVVAVRLERSPELVVSLLAVLRAGGAYLPIDPSYPTQRQGFMLEDSGARVLITLAALSAGAPFPGTLRVVALDEEAAAITARSAEAPDAGVRPEHLAYVIYTSGSTGNPKGAMNAHRGIVNRLLWMQEEYGLDASDAVLQKTPYSFDVSVWEFFWPLMTGARLVLARPEGHRDPGYLREVVEAQGITTLHFVPSMLRPFLDAEGVEGCAGLRRVVCSGEALPQDLTERFAERLPGAELHNLYGPTEAAVDVTYWRCERQREGSAVPIGRPVANTRVYLLDGRGHPVPPGMPGELYIGGVQVGRGYLGRPSLTAERFVPDPFGAEPGGRLYRTGDLARHRAGGTIEFLGRIDHQVKVRGFRIELGEVEAALREAPGVGEAAVTAGEGASGAPRLVAYVAAAPGAGPGPDELRAHLRARLPEYMVPSAFVFLEALPLTPSGKLDRRALPEPGPERPWLAEEYVAPQNVVEDTLAAIWSRVLGVELVGIHDNFFALGGDSILSLRVAALARERGLPVSIRNVAMHPTIAELAAVLETEQSAGESEPHTEPFSLVSGEDRGRLPEGVVDAYPLAQLQLGMLYHKEKAPEARMFHGLSSFHLRMEADEAAFARAVAYITARHPSLRTGFDLTSYSQPLQVVYGDVDFPVGFYDLRHLSQEEQNRELRRFWQGESDRPFDLARPPQLRIDVHRRTDETLQLTLLENHLISDGWSLHTVMMEILNVYFALLRGEPLPELTPLHTTYRDFIYLERRALESREAREFWEAQVQDYEPADLPRLPGHRPEQGRRVWRIDRVIPDPVVDDLRRLARDQSVPLKSVLLAAHARVLSFLTGRTDVVTGLSSNGRLERVDGDRVTGLFLNTLPLRLNTSTGGSWADLARRTYEAELAVMPYRRYPLSAIQAAAGPRPLFDASFVYLNFHVMAEGARSGSIGYEQGSAFLEETNYAISAAFQHLVSDRKRIAVSLECDRWVFSDAQIPEIVEYYLRTLEAMAADPAARYETFSPLSEVQRERLRGLGSGEPAPLDAPLHHRFEAFAARAPEAACVASPAGVLSYGEVNRRADRLARRLRALGVGPESRVAILMDRVPEVVPALLAVLKAGGAYVPLDPAHPRERLEWLLGDSGAEAVLTLERWLPRAAGLAVPVVSLDAGAEADDPPGDGKLPAAVEPASLAYVIYTSGTTGRPKAVMVEHRQLMHYTGAALRRLALPEGGRYALISTFTADLGNTVLFPALATGGTLHVLSEREATDAAALAAYLAGNPVDCLKIVPSHLRALLAHPDPGPLLPRTSLVLGGESADWGLVKRVRELVPECRVFNHYGPTETTVGVVAGEVEDGAADRFAVPPLGLPLGHARVYVLDPHLQPVPLGAAGEIYVGGPAVSRGYLGRPSVTAGRFLPDTFAAGEGGRMYRTGDRGRLLPGGEVEFLGRADDQVKVRGFRVEPREVGAVLRDHPGVDDAAVVARDDGDGEVRLVAYAIPSAERAGVVTRLLEMAADPELDGLERRVLPNGMEVFHLNAQETDFLFREIFCERSYFRHGVTLPAEGACVVDVGANIGMFSLLASRMSRGARVFAFEPIAPVARVLRANLSLYGAAARVFECGVGAREESVTFTFYPKLTVLSGRHARLDRDRKVVQLFARTQSGAVDEALLDEVIDNRLQAQEQRTEVRTLSRQLREEGIDHVDLLKVDVQRAERDVLAGIDPEDWAKIRQVVVEVHDEDGRLAEVVALLEGHGFRVAVEQEADLAATGQHNVFAVRPGTPRGVDAEPEPGERWESRGALEEALRAHLAERLPDAMVPSGIVLLPAFPLTRNGKLDARALPAPEAPGADASADAAPRSETEERLVQLWKSVLKVDHVGIYDSFFELGGDSIKAMITLARIRKAFRVQLSIQTLFDAPTVARLAGSIEAAAQAAPSRSSAPILPAPRDGELPLSFGQQRLWYLQLLDPDSAAHNIPYAFRVRGRLDVDAWRRSLNEIVRRHEVLRTCFPTVDGEPRQVIVPELELEVPVVDLRDRPEAEREEALREIARREAWRPFDLARGPLVRALLVRAGDEDFGSVLTLHHIVFDGWSSGVLMSEWKALYASYLHGDSSPLPDLPFQYADFAHWQREHLREEGMQRQLDYWKQRLNGASTLDLPSDRPRPPVQSFRGAAERIALTRELTDAFHAMSQREGVTPFIALLAAYAVLLHHHSGQDDVVVGSPVVLHRDHLELHGLIGLFINSLPLRVDLSGGPTFRELLVRARGTVLEGFANQDVPFEKVVDALESRRDASRTPIFQVMFSHSAMGGESTGFEGLRLAPLGVADPTSKFDLHLASGVAGDRLVLSLSYNTDLFDAGTARKLLGQTRTLLERVVERADPTLAELNALLEEEERQQRARRAEEHEKSLRLSLSTSKRKAIAVESQP